MHSNVETVKSIYDAFGRGDVAAILDRLHEDVRWEEWADSSAQAAGVPWLVARRGRAGAAEFFGVIGQFRFDSFEVRSLMAGENQVAAEVTIDCTIPSTGAHIRDEEIHLWTFDDAGRVVRFRHYTDTAKHIAAAAG